MKLVRETRNAKDYSFTKRKSIKWYPVTTGGGYRKWYGFYDSVIDIGEEAVRIKNSGNNNARLREPEFYFRSGLTWSKISTRISIRKLREGIVFGSAGPCLFCNDEDEDYLCALLSLRTKL